MTTKEYEKYPASISEPTGKQYFENMFREALTT